MAQFTTTPLLSGGYLVEGTDDAGNTGTTVLMSDKWDMYQHTLLHKQAEEIFDAGVEAAFAPLVAAAEEAQALLDGSKSEFTSVVIDEGVEGQPTIEVHFDLDGTILNILDKQRFELLRWVGNDTLVAIKA